MTKIIPQVLRGASQEMDLGKIAYQGTLAGGGMGSGVILLLEPLMNSYKQWSLTKLYSNRV
jgi:hypothetical protein